MKKSRTISNIGKKRIGRPPVGAVPIMVRIPPSLLKGLDAWIAKQKPPVGRPEAIRALLAEALEVEALG